MVRARNLSVHSSSPTFKYLHEMASQTLTVSIALSMLDIPFPEDDDMSDDEFDGYIDPDETSAEGLDDGNGEDSEQSDDVPPIPDFQQPTGPLVDMTDKSPLDFFKLLVNDAMLDHIVEQTNLYAQQYIDATTLPPHSRVHGWNKEVQDQDELKKFFSDDYHNGSDQLSSCGRLLGNILALCYTYVFQGTLALHHACMHACSCTCMYMYM